MNEPADFDWDNENETEHFEKHYVRFEQGIWVFLDPNRLEALDNRHDYGEERFNVIGQVDELILNVTFTMRDKTARIISARRASRKERERYAANKPE